MLLSLCLHLSAYNLPSLVRQLRVSTGRVGLLVRLCFQGMTGAGARPYTGTTLAGLKVRSEASAKQGNDSHARSCNKKKK